MTQCKYRILEILDYQVFDAKIKNIDFLVEWSPAFVKFSMETWILEMKPVRTVNYKFESRDKLI